MRRRLGEGESVILEALRRGGITWDAGKGRMGCCKSRKKGKKNIKLSKVVGEVTQEVSTARAHAPGEP